MNVIFNINIILLSASVTATTLQFILQNIHLYYTVNHKKRDILFLTITLANLSGFLIVFISF